MEEFGYQTPTIIDDTTDSASATYSSTKIEAVAGTVALITADYTLPKASTKTGEKLLIKNIGSVTYTVTGYALFVDIIETIDDATSQSLAPYEAIDLYSNGTEWYIL